MPHQAARDRRALALAAGQLPGQTVLHASQADIRQRLAHLGALRFAQAQIGIDAERHVALDAEMREQIVILEQGGARPLRRRERRDVGAIDQHLAAQRPLEPADQRQ